MRRRVACLLVALAGIASCRERFAAVSPDGPRGSAVVGDGGLPRALAESPGALADAGTRLVDGSLVTTGRGPAVVARRAPDPDVPLCKKEERRALTFQDTPVYTEKVDKGGSFSARLFVANAASCIRRVSLPLSFTPPKTTATRTVDFVAYVPPRGAFIELSLEADALLAANVVPGRYAITFAVLDEEEHGVGRALSGNPFRLGRDDVAIVAAPRVPPRIGVGEDLVIPLALENVGNTANRITPLVVFTRPGETAGIEHYETPELVVPGASTYTLRLSQETREKEGIGAGSWLVTVTMFDAAGDRMNSFAGLPLTIGSIDLRLARPELPSRVPTAAPIRTTFKLENRGDTADKVIAVIAFTKPGTTSSREFTFTREVPPGGTAFEAVIDPPTRMQKGVDKGVWLVTTAAFRSSGERIKSFTGHYLEILE